SDGPRLRPAAVGTSARKHLHQGEWKGCYGHCLTRRNASPPRRPGRRRCGPAGRTATVVLSGAAALVAGAVSMGTGEDISVTNQNELVHAEVALERTMLARFPAAERDELAPRLRRRCGHRDPDGRRGIRRPGHGAESAYPRGTRRGP